jgi:hypothetical protein
LGSFNFSFLLSIFFFWIGAVRTGTSAPLTGKPEQMPMRGGLDRFGAIAEVTLAFELVHVTYRALNSFTLFGQWDAQTNLVRGLTKVTFTVIAILLCRRSFAASGLGTEH